MQVVSTGCPIKTDLQDLIITNIPHWLTSENKTLVGLLG